MNPSDCGVTPSASQYFLPHIHKNVGGENNSIFFVPSYLSLEPLSPPLLHSKSNKSNNESNNFFVTFGRGFCT